MKTVWLLMTKGDPLGAVRKFLGRVWLQDGLESMLVPTYQEGGAGIAPSRITNPGLLAQADPFAPRVDAGTARMALKVPKPHPKAQVAILLRSCEARAFQWLVEQKKLSSKNWLVIGVDCLGCYPETDFEWRVGKAGAVESLTREMLRFARQGGVAPYRYRHACQMCASPAAQGADLSIELLGLPVKQHVLITAKNEEIARKYHLHELTDGMASPSLVVQRQRLLSGLAVRRQRILERMMGSLSPEAPGDVDGLIQHIAGCAPCVECLNACPTYTGDFFLPSPGAEKAGSEAAWAVRRWLQACVACGMCEEACPRHLQLTAMISRINRRLQAAGTPAPEAYPMGIAP